MQIVLQTYFRLKNCSFFLLASAFALLSNAGLCKPLNPLEIESQIFSLPKEDINDLDHFFRNLLFYQGFAYTLFGDKPISIARFDPENESKADAFRTPSRGYNIWKKYAPLFPQKEYLFLFYEDSIQDHCEITLINKKAFLAIFDKHKDKFIEVFGDQINAEKLLKLLIQRRSLWSTAMKDREDLIGILLGYGKINAELFQKRNELVDGTRGIKKKRSTPSQGYHSIEEEKMLHCKLRPVREEKKSLALMELPHFVAVLDHEETIELKKKYIHQRKQITQIYNQANFLETTFRQLFISSKKNETLAIETQ